MSRHFKLLFQSRLRGKQINLPQTIDAIEFNAHDTLLNHLLDEISREEDSAGRGMLSVIVVHKTGDHMPGPGFFELAKALGREIPDKERFWIKEHKGVCTVWFGSS
jgi:hypothetical protein